MPSCHCSYSTFCHILWFFAAHRVPVCCFFCLCTYIYPWDSSMGFCGYDLPARSMSCWQVVTTGLIINIPSFADLRWRTLLVNISISIYSRGMVVLVVIIGKFLFRALEAACAAYASLNLSLLHYRVHYIQSWPWKKPVIVAVLVIKKLGVRWSRSQHNIRTIDEDTPFFCLSARLAY